MTAITPEVSDLSYPADVGGIGDSPQKQQEAG